MKRKWVGDLDEEDEFIEKKIKNDEIFPVYSSIEKLVEDLDEEAKIFQYIGTHDQCFHCDEALACGLLSLTKKFEYSAIVRTRNEEDLKKCNILVDVGMTYNPEKNRFDHHQNEFKETFNENYSIKLSSAGLIYKHYGKEILKNMLEDIDEKDLNMLFEKIYCSFILEIDALDNGVDIATEKKYEITTNLSRRVSRLNPSWNNFGEYDPNEDFRRAIYTTLLEFKKVVFDYNLNWLPARKFVYNAIEKRSSVHESGQIIQLEKWMARSFI